MYKRILVPLDGSMLAEQVLPIAARFARAWHATLYLVQINDLFSEAEACHIPLSEHLTRIIRRHLIQDEAYLTKLACSLPCQQSDIRIIVCAGAIVPTLLEIGHAYHCDLIMLSSHGAENNDRHPLGNVAESILLESNIPVFIYDEREIISTSRQTLQSELMGIA